MNPQNAEFKALLERSGWSQAEAARRLQLSPPQVSRYLNDDPSKATDTPSRQTLQLFKIILSSEQSDAVSALHDAPAAQDEALISEVRKLKDQVDVLYSKLVSSKLPSAERAAGEKAAGAARRWKAK